MPIPARRLMILSLACTGLAAPVFAEPCHPYVQVEVPSQHRDVWVCAHPDWRVKVDPQGSLRTTRQISGESTVVTVSGQATILIGPHTITVGAKRVLIDGQSMGRDRNAAIGVNGSIVMGGFIRNFD